MDKKIIARNQFLILIFASTLLVFNCQNRTNNFKKIPLDFNQITYFDSEILILFKKKQSWGSGFLYLLKEINLA